MDLNKLLCYSYLFFARVKLISYHKDIITKIPFPNTLFRFALEISPALIPISHLTSSFNTSICKPILLNL